MKCVKHGYVWRSNIQERPWRSEVLSKFYVFVSKWMWDVPKTYTTKFRGLTSGHDPTNDPQGSLMNGPWHGNKLPKQWPNDDPKDGLLVYQQSVQQGQQLDLKLKMSSLHLDLSFNPRDPTNSPLVRSRLWGVQTL